MTSIDLGGALDVLANQDLLLGVFLAGAGLVFMAIGLRIYRSLVAISFGVLGFVICSLLAGGDAFRLMLGMGGAIILGAVSTHYNKPAVVLLAAAWSGYAAALAAAHFELTTGIQLGIGLVAAGMAVSLALIMNREVTAFVLSFEGSLLVTAGAVVFLNQKPILWASVRDMLLSYPIFAPGVLLAVTVTGFYWQMSELRQRDAGTTS